MTILLVMGIIILMSSTDVYALEWKATQAHSLFKTDGSEDRKRQSGDISIPRDMKAFLQSLHTLPTFELKIPHEMGKNHPTLVRS